MTMMPVKRLAHQSKTLIEAMIISLLLIMATNPSLINRLMAPP